MNRSARQVALSQVGEEGQARIGASTVLIIGPDGVIDSVLLSSTQDFVKMIEEKKRELAARVTRPVARLAQGAGRIEAGNYVDPVDVDQDDESIRALMAELELARREREAEKAYSPLAKAI